VATFTKQSFIKFCQDVRDNAEDSTPKEKLIERLRNSVRQAVGLEPGGGLDPIDAKTHSRMEGQLLNIIRIVEAHSDERFDVLAVIKKELLDEDG
jgi:hypothetical protein